MKIILIILFPFQLYCQTYFGFNLSPTYLTPRIDDPNIISVYNVNSFKFGINLEVKTSEISAITVEPNINFLNYRYKTTQEIKEYVTQIKVPFIFRFYLGDKTKIVTDMGLGLNMPLSYSNNLQIGNSNLESNLRSAYPTIITGIGLSSSFENKNKFMLIFRREINFDNTILNHEEYSLNFIFSFPFKNKK